MAVFMTPAVATDNAGISLLRVQSRKSSLRKYVFRFAPESGHRSTQSACPFRANGLNRSRGRLVRCSELSRPLLPGSNALLNIGRRSPRADIASAGWKCL
jgi:hypothetical protein